MTQRLAYAKAAPSAFKALLGVKAYLDATELDQALLDLVYLRVSQINGCAYCIDLHSQDLLKRGGAMDRLALLPVWREAPGLFTERERAALSWAEAVTRLGEAGVPDAAFTAAFAVFSDKDLADLTVAIGLMGAFNRLSISFRTPPLALQRHHITQEEQI
ncbi:MAG: ahpD [Rubritepida sp.]|nr:ahpD [Rubritepida sp.]